MRSRWLVCVVLALFVVSAAMPAAAAEGDKMVRTKPGLDAVKVLNLACIALGCTVLFPLDTAPGQTQPSSLVLVRGLLTTVVSFVMSLLGIISIEPDRPVELAQTAAYDGDQASAAVLNELSRRDPMSYYGTTVWQGYLEQPASAIVGVRDAHCSSGLTGAGIVAVIDTGVDREHPALKPRLLEGYDFTGNKPGGGETLGVGQASAAVLNDVYWVNGSTAATIDQASAAVLNNPANAGFGHGTMVAGVVHLVAPEARIMPLKAFGNDGQGYTSDIIRSIHYAVHNGAKVINMSFSRPTSSPELKRAVEYATGRGVIAVASAGNDGRSAAVYPAAFGNVMGIASTSNVDTRSTFSNYGTTNVWVAAPGEGIITTYPGGGFAATWGTSFAAPFVAGAAALLVALKASATNSQVTSVVAKAKRLTSDLNNGRLALDQAILAGRALWPTAPVQAAPATCSSWGSDWTPAQ
jgi:subtilisin family serine protease